MLRNISSAFLAAFTMVVSHTGVALAQQTPCPLRSGAARSWEGFCGNQQTFLGLPGLGTALVHNSIITIPGYNGPGSGSRENLGYGLGWNISFNAYVVRGKSTDELILVSGDGTPTNFYQRQPGIWSSERFPQDPRTMRSLTGGGYVISANDGSAISFRAGDPNGRFFVSETSSLLGSRMTFTRGNGPQAGRIYEIAVDNNRLLKFTYEGDTLASIANLKDGPSASFGYDSTKLISVSAPDDVSWALTYEPDGKIATLAGRSGVPIVYSYGDAGAIQSLTAAGQQIGISYSGNSVQFTAPTGSSTYEYNSGMLTRVVQGNQETTFAYDSLKRATKVAHFASGAKLSEVALTYAAGAAGRYPLVTPASETDENGVKTSYSYNSDWLPLSVSANGRTTRVEYQKINGASLVTTVTSPTGIVTENKYNPTGALVAESFAGTAVAKHDWEAGPPWRLVRSTNLVTGEVTNATYNEWGGFKQLTSDGRTTTFDKITDPSVPYQGTRMVGPTGLAVESFFSPLGKNVQNRLLQGTTEIASSSQMLDLAGQQVRTSRTSLSGEQSNLNLNMGGGGSCLTGGGGGGLAGGNLRREACEMDVNGSCSSAQHLQSRSPGKGSIDEF